MIRSALIAFGLSAGAASAQGLVPTAPVLESCGGTRLVLAADSAPDADDLAQAADVLSARVGGMLSSVFDYTQVDGAAIIVSIPTALGRGDIDLSQLFQRFAVAFHDVDRGVSTDAAIELSDDQIVLASAENAGQSYVLRAQPVLDGTAMTSASPTVDMNNRPAVQFRFSPEAAQIFGEFTAQNIGAPFAIVVRGKVFSAPVIQSEIWGGSGIITGAFTETEAAELAAVLNGGVLPFNLNVIAQESVDGSDPSADFCP